MASSLKINTETADRAFSKLVLEDIFNLDYQIYQSFYEALQSKIDERRVRSALTRNFNQSRGKISNKIRRIFKGAALRAGYRVRADGRFDKTLGSAMDVLRRKNNDKM